VTTTHYAITAGVATTEAECDALDRLAHTTGVCLADLVHAVGKQSGDLLTNLGITVRAPAVPQPTPDPEVVRKLERMYGADPVVGSPAAYRTAVAMERRRQGWTRAGAMNEWQGRVLAGIEAETARVSG
jgi:hypothetical protein